MFDSSTLFRNSRRRFLAAGAATTGLCFLEHSALAAALPSAGPTIHVSPLGREQGDGTASRPFGSLTSARDHVRTLPRNQTIRVLLASGTYYVPQGFELTAADSGTADCPILWQAAEPGGAILTAAQQIKAEQFRKVTNPQTVQRLAPESRDHIVELDLAATGFHNIHRYPDIFSDSGGILDLFVNDRRMDLARYPKTGYMQIKEVLINGGGMEGTGDWKTFYDKGGADQHKPRPGVFVYRDERAERWSRQLDRGVWLKGYWRVPWQNEAVRVAAIDPEHKTITLAVPVPGGIGSKYHRPKGSGQENHWLVNLLEELTAPGEWCLDFQDRKLYFYPPAPLASLDVRLADNNVPVLRTNGASFVHFLGLSVTGSHDHGVHVSGGEDVLLAGCRVRNTTRYGVLLDGGRHHRLMSSDIYATGAGGVWLGGGDEKASPRVAAAHEVVNNHIHHFGEIEKVYAPGVNAGFTGGGGGGHHVAVGMRVANNLIHDGPHAGVLHGSWDHIFEYNEIFRVCTISNDMGYFYCYDTYDRSGSRTFRYNFMHNSPLADGIYFDNDHRDDRLYGNVVYVGGIGFLYKLQHEKYNPMRLHCWNNIAVKCNTGFRFAMREGSEVHDNAAVMCKTPYIFLKGSGEQGPDPMGDLSTGKNLTLDSDESFVNLAGGDLRLKPGSPILKELSYTPIPFEKIGLYRDSYRLSLPADASIKRFSNPDQLNGSSYDIQDR